MAFLVQIAFQTASFLQEQGGGRNPPNLEDPVYSGLLFCCCDKTFWAKATWGGKGYLPFTSRSQFMTEGSHSRNSSRNQGIHHRRMLLSGSLSLACSTSFLLQPRPTCLGRVLPTVDRTLLHQSRQYLTVTATGQCNPGNSSPEVSSNQDDSKLSIKTDQDIGSASYRVS